jgi:hypothetical protein
MMTKNDSKGLFYNLQTIQERVRKVIISKVKRVDYGRIMFGSS